MSISERKVEGVATTNAGQPAPYLTLYLFALPPGETDMMTLGNQTTVVTDDKGRFTWRVPASLPSLNHYITSRSIACYALAADMSVSQFRIAIGPNLHGAAADGAARDLLRQETRACNTQWLLGGAQPIFSAGVPDMSTILLAVSTPDGLPLARQQVQVVQARLPVDHNGAVVYTGTTDEQGRMTMRSFPGSLRLQVFVSGVGFGSTGTFDAAAGQLISSVIPPLAPFARLSGILAPALAAPGAYVSLDRFGSATNAWFDPRATVDADGGWTSEDVLPGNCRLVLTNGKGESESAWVTVQPGEQRSNITIAPKISASGIVAATNCHSNAELSVWGRVFDADRNPMAGVDVYIVFSYPAGIRFNMAVHVVKTDAAGTFQTIVLPTGNGQAAPLLRLVAHQPGFGLAFGDPRVERDPVSGGWTSSQIDLFLPGFHCGLTVRVLQDGQPAPGILVTLTGQDNHLRLTLMNRGALSAETARVLRALLAPTGTTGHDGSVRFANLTPGLWDITANRTRNPWQTLREPAVPSNTSAGVIVRAGEDRSYTLSLLPPSEVVVHVAGQSDLPSGIQETLRFATAPNRYNRATALVLHYTGSGLARSYAPGLYWATARVADKPLKTNAPVGPYFEGTLLVAFSPATTAHDPVLIPVRRIGPASIHVRIQDDEGNPLRGVVTIGDAHNRMILYAASVDAHGAVVFHNVPQGKYTVTARLAGRPDRDALNQPGSPFPLDAALIAGLSQPLPQTVTVQGGEEVSATLGSPLPGYVRLQLIGPFASLSGYRVEARLPADDRLIDSRSIGSKHLIGPVSPGRRILRLFRHPPAPVHMSLLAGEIEVDIKSGQVIHATMTPQRTTEQESRLSLQLTGSVLMADGKTPAWGARAALFVPERRSPLRMARTDSQGNLILSDFSECALWSAFASHEPVVAAWLPGSNGAAVVPYQSGKDVRLVLPKALSLHGRVTVGGQSALGLPSKFHIRVAYMSKGMVNQVLTVDSTAEADGTFQLGGLTPGTYQVQACRDYIWLSETQTIEIGSEDSPYLTLDIAPPGAPILLGLEDRQGNPISGTEMQIARPAGPLTDDVWPASLITDAEGMLRVDGLEAGHHLAIIVGRWTESIRFDVPTWAPDAASVTRTIVL